MRISIIEKVNVEPGIIHYLLYIVVVKSERETKKIRVEFYCVPETISRTFFECCMKVVLLYPKLNEILLRFRSGKIALVAYIKQAFLQIEVNQSR